MSFRVHKTMLRLLAVIAPLCMLAACVKENEVNINPNDNDHATVMFSLQLPSASAPDTRAMSDADENAIGTIDVVAFKDGTYSYRASGTSIEPNGAVDKKKFTVVLRKGEYDLVIVANAPTTIDWSALAGRSKAQAMDLLEATAPTDGQWAANGNIKTIPMWGNVGPRNIGSVVIPEISLLRMVARVNITLTETNSKFVFSSAHLYNYNNKGRLAPAQADWDASPVTAPNLPDAPGRTGGPVNFTATTAGVSCINEIYMFEAAAGSKTTLSTNPCVVVGGTYDGQPAFYRIDFATAPDTYLTIRRNHSYNISITGVANAGHPTANDAFLAGPENITVSIVEWDNGGMGDVVFDGQKYLSVSQGEFTLNRNAQISTLRIKTDVTGGWKATLSGSKDPKASDEDKKIEDGATVGTPWIKINGTAEGSGTATDGDALQFEVEKNESDGNRTAYIHIAAGTRLTYTITVTQTIDSEVSVRIYLLNDSNEKVGEPISTLEFATYASNVTTERKIMVEWFPSDVNLNVSTTNIGGDESFNYGSGDVISTNTLSGGSEIYNLKPLALDAQTGKPFFERNQMVVFNVQSSGKSVSQTLTLRHFNYNATLTTDGVYLLDGGVKSFTIKSNAPWKAYYVRQAKTAGVEKQFITRIGGINTPMTGSNQEIQIAAGGYNLPEGSTISFNVIDEFESTPELYTGDGYIKIVSDGTPEIGTEFFGVIEEEDAKLFCAAALPRGTANSYIVQNSLHMIPLMIPCNQLTLARKAYSEIGSVTDLDAVTAKLLWSDVNKLAGQDDAVVKSVLFVKGATLDESSIIVFPGSGIGNAGVALYQGTTIKWSWHIWNVEYNPYTNYLAETLQASDTWMDRNLGGRTNSFGSSITTARLASGLRYQFGRKDPFGTGYNALYPSVTQNGEQVSIADAVANPMRFYGYDNSNWTTNASTNLWGNGTKTVLDPCPQGYKIPAYTAFNNHTQATGGTYNFGLTWPSYGGYYPHTGMNSNGLGGVDDSNTGRYWSATNYNAAQGRALQIYDGATSNTGIYDKRYGLAVRCVKQ